MDEERAGLMDRLRLLSERDATGTAMFQQAAASRYGLGITEMRSLSILLREGPQSAGALAVRLHLTSGAVTGIVDRLEKHGMARRSADPSDRRKVVISAEPSELTGEQNVYQDIGAEFADLYANYSLTELQFLARHLEASIEVTRQATERLAADRDGVTRSAASSQAR